MLLGFRVNEVARLTKVMAATCLYLFMIGMGKIVMILLFYWVL